VNNWLFIYLAIYAQYATQKGNSYYGYRSGAFTFYAMTPNETQFNSFLFNACLDITVCNAVVMIFVLFLPSYTGYSIVGFIMHAVYGSEIFGRIAGVSFFLYIFVIMSIVTIVGLAIKGSDRIRYHDEFAKLIKQGKSEEQQLIADSSEEEEGGIFK